VLSVVIKDPLTKPKVSISYPETKLEVTKNPNYGLERREQRTEIEGLVDFN